MFLNGNRTKLTRVNANSATDEFATIPANTCGAHDAAAAPKSKVGVNAAKLNPAPDSFCLWALAYGDCCGACFCVHRDLGLPGWVDNICCGGGC